MNYKEALDYIHSTHWLGSKPGLSRTRTLLDLMGNPHKDLRFIHVAGTNGKGSFCAMLSAVLEEAGYRTGRYTSPYVYRFNERIAFNGKDIDDETLARLCDRMRPLADTMSDPPTEFERITALAMDYFQKKACDFVVLECGMGGRLDSTNVIDRPILSVITGISLDHTAFLGETIEKIAAEKAGIIKAGVPCLYCGEDSRAAAVIEQVAKEKDAPFYTCTHNARLISASLEKTVFDWNAWHGVEIPLLGLYQIHNACHVLQAVELLRAQGVTLPEDAVRRGLARVRWRARFEVIARDPLIICDGGHNPEGVASAVASVRYYFKDQKVLLVSGVMKDKDVAVMADLMRPIAKEVFCVAPDNPRSLDADTYAGTFTSLGVPAHAFQTPKEALQSAISRAKATGAPILCLGSLYLYREICDAWDAIGPM